MPEKIKIQGTKMTFPNKCVVCMQPAQQTYKLERIFTYGQKTITITLPVPMCTDHHTKATTKGAAEKLWGKIGLIAGIVVGLLVAAGLFIYWATSGQGNTLVNLLIAAFVGLGFFLIVWVATAFWLAPTFAPADIKASRHAVRLAAFLPGKNILELEFINDQAAKEFARENAPIILG